MFEINKNVSDRILSPYMPFIDDAKKREKLVRKKRRVRLQTEAEDIEAANEKMAEAIAAAEAESAKRRATKVTDPIRRKRSNIPRHETARPSTFPSTSPSSTIFPEQQAEQTEALLEAFFVGTIMEFLSDQRNIDS